MGAEYATVTCIGFEQRVTLLAFIKPLAGIGGHDLALTVTAYGTGNRRSSNHASSSF